jgi:hypothetical protein
MREVIEIYLDDSGKESDHTHRFVVLAGYMAGEGLPWNRLYQSWRHLLLKHELPHVHMKDILKSHAPKVGIFPSLTMCCASLLSRSRKQINRSWGRC